MIFTGFASPQERAVIRDAANHLEKLTSTPTRHNAVPACSSACSRASATRTEIGSPGFLQLKPHHVPRTAGAPVLACVRRVMPRPSILFAFSCTCTGRRLSSCAASPNRFTSSLALIALGRSAATIYTRSESVVRRVQWRYKNRRSSLAEEWSVKGGSQECWPHCFGWPGIHYEATVCGSCTSL